MSNRTYPSDRLYSCEHGPVCIRGHFAVDPGVGIVANSRFGNGWAVAYTAAGRFTITTTDTYRHVVSAVATYSPTTGIGDVLTPLPPAGGAGAVVTWELRLWTGAAVADPAAATDEFHFSMVLSNHRGDRAAW